MNTHQNEEGFAKFGTNFQENLCHQMLLERAFCDQMQEVLDINFLELTYLQVFTRLLFGYKAKYKTHPTFNTISTLINTEIENEADLVQEQTKKFFKQISGTVPTDAEYIKTTSLEFCRKQVLKRAFLKSIPLLQQSSFEDIQKLINEAMKLGSDNNFGHDFIADFARRYNVEARNPISTGWDPLDKITKGGFGRKELSVVIAPTGAGKSFIMVHVGSTALKQGKTVVYYTLELSEEEIGQRFDSCMTGFALDSLMTRQDEVLAEIQDLCIPGQLIIKEYPPSTASTQTIRKHLDKLKSRSIEPDIIIIDYGDKLRPIGGNSKNEKRHDLEDTFDDMRSIGQEYDCHVASCTQSNRSGYDAEIVTLEAIAEAYSKCFPADLIYTLSRTIQDKMTNNGRVFVAKNRAGRDGIIFPAYVDWAFAKIDVMPPLTVEEQQQQLGGLESKEEQRKSMREKWLKMKEEKEKEKNNV